MNNLPNVAPHSTDYGGEKMDFLFLVAFIVAAGLTPNNAVPSFYSLRERERKKSMLGSVDQDLTARLEDISFSSRIILKC